MVDSKPHSWFCDAQYMATNPFEWMDMISLTGKTNFFEKRVGEYQKANVKQTKEDRVFTINADF